LIFVDYLFFAGFPDKNFKPAFVFAPHYFTDCGDGPVQAFYPCSAAGHFESVE